MRRPCTAKSASCALHQSAPGSSGELKLIRRSLQPTTSGSTLMRAPVLSRICWIVKPPYKPNECIVLQHWYCSDTRARSANGTHSSTGVHHESMSQVQVTTTKEPLREVAQRLATLGLLYACQPADRKERT